MKKYTMRVTETRDTTVTVEAESRREAENEVKRLMEQGAVSLDGVFPTKTQLTHLSEREVSREDYMRVLMVSPGTEPYPKMIGKTLADMQHAVGGNIEAVYFFDDPIAIICNEEGKLQGLRPNRALKDSHNNVVDVIAGDFFIAGITDDDFTGLTPELEKKYSDVFRSPENFIRLGEKLIAIPAGEISRPPFENMMRDDGRDAAAKSGPAGEMEI